MEDTEYLFKLYYLHSQHGSVRIHLEHPIVLVIKDNFY